jgi:hypothetical protein
MKRSNLNERLKRFVKICQWYAIIMIKPYQNEHWNVFVKIDGGVRFYVYYLQHEFGAFA